MVRRLPFHRSDGVEAIVCNRRAAEIGPHFIVGRAKGQPKGYGHCNCGVISEGEGGAVLLAPRGGARRSPLARGKGLLPPGGGVYQVQSGCLRGTTLESRSVGARVRTTKSINMFGGCLSRAAGEQGYE